MSGVKKILGMAEIVGQELKLKLDPMESKQHGFPEEMWFACTDTVKKHLPLWQQHFGNKVYLLIQQFLPGQRPAGTVMGLSLPKD